MEFKEFNVSNAHTTSILLVQDLAFNVMLELSRLKDQAPVKLVSKVVLLVL